MKAEWARWGKSEIVNVDLERMKGESGLHSEVRYMDSDISS